MGEYVSSRNIVHFIVLLIIDIITLMALFYLSIYIRNGLHTSKIPVFIQIELINFAFAICVIIFFFINEKIYTFRYDFWQESKKIIKSIFLSYLLVLTILALMKSNLNYSRLFITIYFILALIVIPLVKRYSKKFLYTFDFFKKKVLIIGDEAEKRRFQRELRLNFYLGQIYSDVEYDFVIIISKGLSLNRLNNLTHKYVNSSDGIYIVPYMTNINFAHSTILEYENIQLNSIYIENRLLIKHNIWLKELFDKLFTISAIPIFSIIHMIISSLIKLDSQGTIFFKQPRLGKNNKDFLCYKYRTMYENSDNILEKYLKNNPKEVEYYNKYHKYRNDPRVTRVGKILRSTSLDELPQLINVLKGDMSLVGPRPYMLSEADKLGKDKEFILKVKPGITGLWQVSGRNNLSFEERNQLEVWYIKNWLFWDDFIILIKTIKVVLLKIGAK
jgi:undecaprenyl-phosphate galactose phosphotransferase